MKSRISALTIILIILTIMAVVSSVFGWSYSDDPISLLFLLLTILSWRIDKLRTH